MPAGTQTPGTASLSRFTGMAIEDRPGDHLLRRRAGAKRATIESRVGTLQPLPVQSKSFCRPPDTVLPSYATMRRGPTIAEVAEPGRREHDDGLARAFGATPRCRGNARPRRTAPSKSSATGPTALARSLRTRRSHTVALIIPDITNPYYPALARGIQNVLADGGYHVLVCNTDREPRYEARVRRGRARPAGRRHPHVRLPSPRRTTLDATSSLDDVSVRLPSAPASSSSRGRRRAVGRRGGRARRDAPSPRVRAHRVGHDRRPRRPAAERGARCRATAQALAEAGACGSRGARRAAATSPGGAARRRCGEIAGAARAADGALLRQRPDGDRRDGHRA